MNDAPAKLYDVGIYYDVTAEAYHADCAIEPSLSRSVAWTLAQRAAIHGYLEHPRLNIEHKSNESNAAMDFGSLAHELLLGQEGRIAIGNYDDFKTKAAQAWRDLVKADNKIPALEKNYNRAQELKECAHSFIVEAGFGDEFDRAKSEVTVIAKTEDGLYLRARFDKLLIDIEGAKNRQHSETAIQFDIKITKDASPEACKRQIGKIGYDLQEYFYQHALALVDPSFAGRQKWVTLFIENEFPHCVTAIETNNTYKTIGKVRFDRAMEKWRHGIKNNDWPTFMQGKGAYCVSPPRYLEMQELEDEL